MSYFIFLTIGNPKLYLQTVNLIGFSLNSCWKNGLLVIA
jgi:arginine exporter protein ArgO